ncbi:sulfite exporter TauE/SafE family protein [Beijerinckia indica]|uniref:Probable membrane transporter protein n=1 Tax=Beijerinckia indica subsp. indica (strain ATCC 9039 / DSM 1715 / NCIMB 8712) TaxID=395963 RepID=B2IG76_BEII9|nr:sulfite exporter TauE/SafE family protein [Beijerinckia indica]ACB97150.1 permease-like protein [Beijerinckia indica subsp. indica ATCC 9039]
MDWTIIILLFVAGLLGGLVNAIAGGATLLTFPAMLAAGLPPVVANASNAVAIAPGHLLAALADWTKLRPFDQSVILSLMIAIIGGALGALLVLALPERLFVLPIPGLIGLATCLFAFAPQIQSWTHKRNGRTRPSPIGDFAALASASLYGSFFGAGLGIVLTALLSMAGNTLYADGSLAGWLCGWSSHSYSSGAYDPCVRDHRGSFNDDYLCANTIGNQQQCIMGRNTFTSTM